jgi:endonuclease YncB( thermonuclease family)
MFLAHTRGRTASSIVAAAAIFAAGLGAGAVLAPNLGRPIAARAAPAAPQSAATAISRTAYPVEVMRVIDGDTFDARVRAWPGIEIATKIRLRSIDAPETRGRCERELAQAQAAHAALAAMLAEGEVMVTQVGLDKYGGRVLAHVATRRIDDVAAALLEAGLVRRYTGGKRESWC